jgi:hypothetical protein
MEAQSTGKRNLGKLVGYTLLGIFGVTGLSLAFSGVGTSVQQLNASEQQAAAAAGQPTTPPSSSAPQPASPANVFNTTLGLGSSGTIVANVQQFLADEGLYSGPDNGEYDQATHDAVVAFEDEQHLSPADGVFGPGEQEAANVILVAHPDWLTALSNNHAYANVNGSTVHSPAYSSNGIPVGASAVCGDGTYSFSMHHSGTCSHHGGVSQWLQ